MEREMSEEEKQAIRDWAAAWKVVNHAEIEELRRTTPEEKFRQLASLMRTARAMQWESHTPSEIAGARAAWIRLKERLGTRT